MRTGVAYMGHHNPKHLETDMLEMKGMQLDDVLLAAQENDFVHFPGKIHFMPQIALEHGLRPIAIFWGALNLFGGGRSSQFLLEHPEGLQVDLDGSRRAEGCYVNPICVSRITEMIDVIAKHGFCGYFVDEPTPLRSCYCSSCRNRFDEWYRGDLASAASDQQEVFRQKCVVEYIRNIADYCKARHPQLETMSCLMPTDSEMWGATSEIASLDNIGTDIYWVNEERNIEEMIPLVRELDAICKKSGKKHHEWLQCWGALGVRERRILEQGHVLIREKPDALYVWAWKGQIGTAESCHDPEASWRYACEVLKTAKNAA